MARGDAGEMAQHLMRYPELVSEFMFQYELDLHDPRQDRLARKGAATFLGFMILGAIPLVPCFLGPAKVETFRRSIAATFVALALLWLQRWHLTRERLLRSVGETVLIGGACAGSAYGVGLLFRGRSGRSIGPHRKGLKPEDAGDRSKSLQGRLT